MRKTDKKTDIHRNDIIGRISYECVICRTKFYGEKEEIKYNCPNCLSWHNVNLSRGETVTDDKRVRIYKYLLSFDIEEQRLLSGVPMEILHEQGLWLCPKCYEKGISIYATGESCYKCGTHHTKIEKLR